MTRMRTSGIIAALMVMSMVSFAGAEPAFWTSECAGCHSDDTATCDGCHEHDGNIQAHAGSPAYGPGDPVTVFLTGGSRGGWIRALLYDEDDNEIYRAGGPTGTGDDGQGDRVMFPVELAGVAPLAAGTYVWEAAWYGNNNGNGHYEIRRAVTIEVSDVTGIPQTPVDSRSWAEIKALY